MLTTYLLNVLAKGLHILDSYPVQHRNTTTNVHMHIYIMVEKETTNLTAGKDRSLQ